MNNSEFLNTNTSCDKGYEWALRTNARSVFANLLSNPEVTVLFEADAEQLPENSR